MGFDCMISTDMILRRGDTVVFSPSFGDANALVILGDLQKQRADRNYTKSYGVQTFTGCTTRQLDQRLIMS